MAYAFTRFRKKLLLFGGDEKRVCIWCRRMTGLCITKYVLNSQVLKTKFHLNLSADCLIIYEDERLGARARGASLSGPELASLMKIGARVVRGKDWKWGDQVRCTL